MKREYKLFLKDILENIEKINCFVEGLDFEHFKNDEKTIYAVVRSLEIIGEAVACIPDNIKEKYEDIPWKDIKNFRNKVVHKYWGVDLEIVWDIIENELESLAKNLKLIE